MQGQPPELRQVLQLVDRIRHEWYAERVLGGIMSFLSVALGVTLLFVCAETFLGPPGTVRWVMLITLASIVAAAGVIFVGRRLIENPSDEQIALLAENAHTKLHNELINAIRFSLQPPERRHSFVRAAIRESDSVAEKIEPRGIVNWQTTRRASVLAGVLVVIWGVVLLMAPARVANALTRVIMPSANIRKVGSVRIVSITPGDTTVIAGDNLTIEAVLDNSEETTAAVLEHFPEEGAVHKEPMIRAEANRFTCELIDIKTPRTYRVVVGRARSQSYAINVTERPLVTGIGARYVYPEYTGRPEETIAETSGRIQALKGTKAAITIACNKRLRSARLVFEKTKPLEFNLAPDGATATIQRRLTISENLAGVIEITDTFDCTNSRSVQITAHKDQPPQVKIVAPGEDSVLAVGETLELSISGTDDYGIVRAELLEKRLSLAAGGAATPRIIKTWGEFSDTKNVALHWKWQFDEKSYKNDEIIRYFVRMVDGNTIDAPGVGTSAEFTIRLEDVEARSKQRAKKFSNWQDELQKVLQQQKELRRNTGAMQPTTQEKKSKP